jgi:hypothetical protein
VDRRRRRACGNCGKLGALCAESFPSAVETVGKSLGLFDFSSVSIARQFPQALFSFFFAPFFFLCENPMLPPRNFRARIA